MKNMKKLLGAMAALGFTTVAAVNVVSCYDDWTITNDLLKSFVITYSVPFSKLTDSGVVLYPSTNKYNFIFGTNDSSGIKPDVIALIVPKHGATIEANAVKKNWWCWTSRSTYSC